MQSRLTLVSRPVIVGEHGHARLIAAEYVRPSRNLQHLPNAWHCKRGFGIEPAHACIDHRRAGNDGDQHARQRTSML